MNRNLNYVYLGILMLALFGIGCIVGIMLSPFSASSADPTTTISVAPTQTPSSETMINALTAYERQLVNAMLIASYGFAEPSKVRLLEVGVLTSPAAGAPFVAVRIDGAFVEAPVSTNMYLLYFDGGDGLKIQESDNIRFGYICPVPREYPYFAKGYKRSPDSEIYVRHVNDVLAKMWEERGFK